MRGSGSAERRNNVAGIEQYRLRLVAGLAISTLAITLLLPPWTEVVRAEAQQVWTEPVILFDTTGDVRNPVILADSEGGVHVFFTTIATKPLPGAIADGALMYMRLSGGRWTQPADVLVSPGGGGAQDSAVTLDKGGVLHVVWTGGQTSQVWYRRAHASLAGSSQAWSEPVALSDTSALKSAITVGPDDALHVLFATTEGGVYYRRSPDHGSTWTGAVMVSNNDTQQTAGDLPNITADAANKLYAAWTEFHLPQAWPPAGAFSASSRDGGLTWTSPIRVAGENYGDLQTAASGVDLVYRVWKSVANLGEHWHQRSTDGGQTWSPAQQIWDRWTIQAAWTGFSPIAVDSSGNPHLVTSVRGKRTQSEDVYHVAWDGTAWTRPVYLSRGATGARSVEQPSIAISLGNRLHVVYEDDFARIWYTNTIVDAPAIAARPLAPAPLPTPPTQAPTPPPAPPTRPPAPAPLTRAASVQTQATPDPSMPLLIGLAPCLLVLGLLVVRRLAKLKERA